MHITTSPSIWTQAKHSYLKKVKWGVSSIEMVHPRGYLVTRYLLIKFSCRRYCWHIQVYFSTLSDRMLQRIRSGFELLATAFPVAICILHPRQSTMQRLKIQLVGISMKISLMHDGLKSWQLFFYLPVYSTPSVKQLYQMHKSALNRVDAIFFFFRHFLKP